MKKDITALDVVDAVCRATRTTRWELLSPSRRTDVAVARTLAIAILHKEFGLSAGQIGPIILRNRGSVYDQIHTFERYWEYMKGRPLDGCVRDFKGRKSDAMSKPYAFMNGLIKARNILHAETS